MLEMASFYDFFQCQGIWVFSWSKNDDDRGYFIVIFGFEIFWDFYENLLKNQLGFNWNTHILNLKRFLQNDEFFLKYLSELEKTFFIWYWSRWLLPFEYFKGTAFFKRKKCGLFIDFCLLHVGFWIFSELNQPIYCIRKF